MNGPPPGLLAAPPASPTLDVAPGAGALVWTLALLALAVFFSVLRAALQHAHPERVLGHAATPRARARLQPLLERVDALAASAAALEITCDLAFLGLLLRWLAGEIVTGAQVVTALAIAVPVLLLFTEAFPAAVARRLGERFVVRVLPVFHVLQLPVGWLVSALAALRKALMRMLHLPEHSPQTRRIVEDLRQVIEDAARSKELDASERAIIENVMELRDLDVAAIMTPRTEIRGVAAGEPLESAARVVADSGHTRVPVYLESLDTVVGTLGAVDVARAVANGGLASGDLRSIVQPAYFVPETKRVSELLTELRARKQKLAIVLDEYGGTAGLVTLTDVLEEIVGDIADEYEEREEPIRLLADGSALVQATIHVSEVNEALGLGLPEEADFETLGGFVLAELGRFPRKGERFRHRDHEFSIADASDRRVYKVRVGRSA